MLQATGMGAKSRGDGEKMLIPDEALAVILRYAEPLCGEVVELSQSLGRVLRSAVWASKDRALPPWDNSAMDGYAVRAADVQPGQPLPVRGVVAAGHPGNEPLPPHSAMRIMTGAPLPPGADAVIMREEAEEKDGQVVFKVGATVGQQMRRAGEDIAPGEKILTPGTLIGPGEIGLLAALGRTLIEVYRRPVVAIVSTGDELVAADFPPGPGQIVNSNMHALTAQITEAGGQARALPIARDDREVLKESFAEALRADVVVSSGGVSVGEFDYVRDVLRELGAIEEFSKVAMKPGKPLTFARVGVFGAEKKGGRRVLCFGLPGNPASSMVSFELFVRPALRRLQGHATAVRPRVFVKLANPLMPERSRQHFVRARVVRPFAENPEEATLLAHVSEKQGSGMLRSMIGVNALLHIPPGPELLPAGTAVLATLFSQV